MGPQTPETLFGIAAIWAVAAVTPGPNFFVTVRTAVARSRGAGLAAAGGIATGTALWGLAGFFGISALFALVPWVYGTMKIVGGLYLAYLGLRLIAASFAHPGPAARPSPRGSSAFRLGLWTNLSNPKTAAFVASLFASTLPADPSLALGAAAAGIMVAVSLAWYGAVAVAFAAPPMTRLYARAGHLVDRIAGGIFILFGAKLALDR